MKYAATPFLDDAALPIDAEETRGELAGNASSVLVKALWLCRLSRPDMQKAIQQLATKVKRWSVNDDKRISRVMCYLWSSRDYVLTGTVTDHHEDLFLQLFVDADLAGECGL